jgi:hypothetical protein
LSWFGKLGATHPNDDALPILDIGAKAYREMLKSSTISIFDFRIYLFACHGYLLGRLGRITEIAKRGQWFVASLSRRLRENEVSPVVRIIVSLTVCRAIWRSISSSHGRIPRVWISFNAVMNGREWIDPMVTTLD